MSSHWAGPMCHNRSAAQPAREASMQRWWRGPVCPQLLSSDGFTTLGNKRGGWGVSDLLNRMTTAYKTGDYQLTVSKTSAGPFNRSCSRLYGGEGTHHTPTPWMIYLFYDPGSEVLRDLLWQTCAFQMNWCGRRVLENGTAFNQWEWSLILAFAVPFFSPLSFLSSSLYSSPCRGPPV